MEKLAFLFPGQGSQRVGMGRDLWDKYPEVREVYRRANDALGFDLRALSFEGPEAELRESRNAQVAILVHSIATLGLLHKEGISPSVAAGHSLGEYSALVAAGSLSFEDALHVVRFRGELMSRAGEESPGTMAAIMGLPAEDVELACKEASEVGVVTVANYNSREQTVISGETGAVEGAVGRAKAKGAKRAIVLNVSGAFHSPLMETAFQKFGKVLSKTEIGAPKIPVVANVSGQVVEDAQSIREALESQIVSPVRWLKCVETMVSLGATIFVEVGPGRVLNGLLRRIEPGVKGLNAEDSETVTQVLEALREMKR